MARTDARRLAILEALREAGTVRVADLAGRFDISEVSVRRDLVKLEQYGLLQRVHGGATSIAAAPRGHSYEDRLRTRAEEKRRIGRAAAALVQPGDCVILDSGTTVLQVARELSRGSFGRGQLTAITGSLPAFRELATASDMTLVVLGGVFLSDYQTLVGPQTLDTLSSLHADKLFLGADGISFSHGVTTRSVLEAEVSKAMIRVASEIIVVSDSRKIDSVSFTSILELSRLNRLVTDSDASPQFIEALRREGVEVILT